MTKFRLLLLASTALSAMQFVSFASHAQSTPQVLAPQVLAQTDQEKEKEKKGPPPKPGTPPARSEERRVGKECA